MNPDSLQSYFRFMKETLFDLVDIPKDQIHIPDGTLEESDIAAYCQEYEDSIRQAGGIAIHLLGSGRTGHIGFNDPGSRPDSEPRLITLDKVTRQDAASDFFGEENVPRRAITMGVGTIMKARRIFLMAWVEEKAGIIKKTVEGELREHITATNLQNHPDSDVILNVAD